MGDIFGWMRQAVQTTMQGMADKLSVEEKKRAAAVHTGKLILGDGATIGEYLVLADYIIHGKNEARID